jgi:hypothetical protein
MGISVGCQGLSRVIDELFSDLKGRFLFNFLDDVVVYPSTREEHVGHLREVMTRLQAAGYTLNPGQVNIGCFRNKVFGTLPLRPRS